MSGLSGMHRADEQDKRQKTETFDHSSTFYGQNASARALPAYPPFLSSSAGHPAYPNNRDFGMPHMNLGSSANFPGVNNPALLMPPVPAAGASGEEQRRFFEQYRLLQQLMQAQSAPYYLNQQQPQGFAGGAGAYNPYMMMPFSGGPGQDPSHFGMHPGAGKYPGMPYDPYAAQQFPHYPNMAGYFPPREGGQYPAHPTNPVDLSGLLLSASAHIAGGSGNASSSGLSASAAAMAATMSQASTEASIGGHGAHSSSSESRSRGGTALSTADSEGSGHLLTLSEAVSSLPVSHAGSPEGFDVSYMPHSRSRSNTVNSAGGSGGSSGGATAAAQVSPMPDRTSQLMAAPPMHDRTSQLLAAAAAMMGGSGVNTPRSPAGQARRQAEEDEEEDEAESDWRDQLYYWTGRDIMHILTIAHAHP
jgi:hypothetical protein